MIGCELRLKCGLSVLKSRACVYPVDYVWCTILTVVHLLSLSVHLPLWDHAATERPYFFLVSRAGAAHILWSHIVHHCPPSTHAVRTLSAVCVDSPQNRNYRIRSAAMPIYWHLHCYVSFTPSIFGHDITGFKSPVTISNFLVPAISWSSLLDPFWSEGFWRPIF